jgi:plasmid stabilization system protein ParE
VVLSDEAIEDLTSIWAFVGESSETSADRLIDELAAHCERVGLFPNRYSIVEGGGELPVRRTTVRTWAIFFRVKDNHVQIVRIVHGGRRILDLNLGR